MLVDADALRSGTNPANVLGFLDVTGDFRPALAFVMVGAIGVHAIAYRAIAKRGRPLVAHELALPARTDVDARLVIGAVLFGIGWGLAGYCPGPALTSLASGWGAPLVFVASLLIAMLAVSLVERRRSEKTEKAERAK